jgi:hypothetical protein
MLDGGRLLVALKSDRHYVYEGIPQDLADGLANAPSKGTFVNAVIKKGGFNCAELDEAGVKKLLRLVPTIAASRKKTRPVPGKIPPELLARYPFLSAVV